jgi:hypothetical protein
MSDAIRVTTNVGAYADRFNRYLRRTIQISRLTTEQVIRREAKGLIKFAFKYTPPMVARSGVKGYSFAKGYSHSKKAIRADLKKALTARNMESTTRVFERTRNAARREQYREILEQLQASPNTVVRFIKQNQKPTKRYPVDGPKHFVTVDTRKQVLFLLEKSIGVTAAGWCAAATALGFNGVPDWVSRWASKNTGSVVFRVSGNVVEFNARNPNRHTDSARIQRILDYAFRSQADSMRRQLISAISDGVLTRQEVFGR